MVFNKKSILLFLSLVCATNILPSKNRVTDPYADDQAQEPRSSFFNKYKFHFLGTVVATVGTIIFYNFYKKKNPDNPTPQAQQFTQAFTSLQNIQGTTGDENDPAVTHRLSQASANLQQAITVQRQRGQLPNSQQLIDYLALFPFAQQLREMVVQVDAGIHAYNTGNTGAAMVVLTNLQQIRGAMTIPESMPVAPEVD
jgi:hypothetical protein